MSDREQAARYNIHKWLLKRDPQYKKLEYARVSETTNECVVRWIDRHGETHEDKFKM